MCLNIYIYIFKLSSQRFKDEKKSIKIKLNFRYFNIFQFSIHYYGTDLISTYKFH